MVAQLKKRKTVSHKNLQLYKQILDLQYRDQLDEGEDGDGSAGSDDDDQVEAEIELALIDAISLTGSIYADELYDNANERREDDSGNAVLGNTQQNEFDDDVSLDLDFGNLRKLKFFWYFKIWSSMHCRTLLRRLQKMTGRQKTTTTMKIIFTTQINQLLNKKIAIFLVDFKIS